MGKNFDYSLDNISKDLERELREAKLLGEGHNGVVFLLKNNRAIKIFRRNSVWKDESDILKRVGKSRFFPKVYEAKKGYIIRECVIGERLDKYLKKNNLDIDICKELYSMILEFERIGFKRIDIRCKDIYIQKNKKIKIIDPKNNYKKVVTFPRHLFKGLFKKGQLSFFFEYLDRVNLEKSNLWRKEFLNYARDRQFFIN